ncbi:hypothetical protein [Hymenobacter metallilatus]|uniref:DUF3575 domain-containing protein n=1 Tax=Hymenobacter metallilatus TaxID=2493666 RepID=A0A3R9P9Z3_9BACT|nr:hypothetical protein [Hymenobacter metallilatus]RSK31774.1 hypothetical protein EI290_13180 [Hymenobacter metallilatus]
MKIAVMRCALRWSSLTLAGSVGTAVAGCPALPPPDDSTFVRQSHRRAVFQFDQRYSILNGTVVGINGVKGGIEWRGRWRAGLGVYRLSGGVPTRAVQPAGFPAGTRDEVRFRYLAAYGEYVFIGNPRWELSTPLQLGIGSYYTKYSFPDGGVLRTNKQVLYLAEPSVAAHYRVFRWVGLGAGTGYRQVFASGQQPEDQISGFIFFGRVKLFLGDLLKVVRGHERLFSQKGLKDKG